jgi:flavin-dependent dehydrogenase
VAALRARADEVGVARVDGAVRDLAQDADGVLAGGTRARFLAVADGLHSPLRRSLGLAVESTGPARYGLRQHFRAAPWTDLVEVHWARDAEAYVTPVAPDVVGVAVLCGGGAPYDVWLDRFPALRQRLRGAEPVSTVRGAGPLRQRSAAVVRGRALLVGDAAGYVDALTGEGLAVGFAAAAELVRCVAADRPGDYPAAWRRVTRRSRLLTEALIRSTRHEPVRSALVPVSARARWLFGTVVNSLA